MTAVADIRSSKLKFAEARRDAVRALTKYIETHTTGTYDICSNV